jgi:hypothetical protein
MGRWTDDEEWDGESDADVESDELDGPEDDDDLYIPCPYCKREIFEESERCPYCERYLSKEDAPAARKPLWFVVGLIACFYVVYRWVFWR